MNDFHYAQIMNYRGPEGPWRFQVLNGDRVVLDFVSSAGMAMELARAMDIGR